MIFKGKVWKFGSNIDTDLIIPGCYLNITNAEELTKHCMEGVEKNFYMKVNRGDILVAGNNFGCGSSREHAPIAIKTLGISCIIAKSFSRIFFRNAINIGLPALECLEADKINQNDILEVNVEKGLIQNLTSGDEFKIIPLPEFIRQIINYGGLSNYLSHKKAEGLS